jgi:hypothetical protein
LDSCGQTTEMKRRLLLTNHDLGVEIHTRMLQPDLNFAVSAPELFAGPEMGEDALRVLGKYLKPLKAADQSDTDSPASQRRTLCRVAGDTG